MSYQGDIAVSQILYFFFTTINPSTGAPITLAGTPAISVYKDDSATQSTAGVTLVTDVDVAGQHSVKIDTSADGTFYAAGHDFSVVITTGTVNGVSAVGYVIAHFSIQNRSALRPTTAGRTLDVTATGEAGIDWANIGAPTTTVNLSGTTIKAVTDGVTLAAAAVTAIWAALTSALTTVGSIGKLLVDNIDATITSRLAPTVAMRTLDVSATGEAGVDWANVGSPTTVVSLSGTTIKDVTDVETAIAAVQSDTDNIQTRLPAALVGGRMDASVGVIATGAIVAGSFSAGAIDATAIANGAIDAATFAAGAIDATAIATGAIDADALATDAVNEIADGVWDEAIAGHLGAGSTGAALNSASSAGDPWATNIPGLYAAGTAGHRLGNIPDVSAGAAGGVFIAGANAATTVNITGNVTGNLSGSVGSVTNPVTVGTNNDKSGYALSAAGNNAAADALLDRANAIETGITLRQAERVILSATAGKSDGFPGNPVHYRDTSDTKDRITATTDADGNRTAVTLDVS